MQKYKQKIVQQDGGYVGYVLQNDEVIFTTDRCRDTNMASREISKFLMKQEKTPRQVTSSAPIQKAAPEQPSSQSNFQTAAPVPVPSRRTNSVIQVPQTTVQNQSAPVRRCCGRG